MSHLTASVTRRALAAAGALAIAAVAIAALLSTTGAATARTPRASIASARTVISARSTSLGKILVDSKGDTIYAFSRDSKNKDACASISGCLAIWPITAVHGKLTAGSGVKQSLLGTITVKGQKQATYDGHPLYGYVDAEGPGDIDYVGVSQSGGTWPAVSPSGALVK